MGGALSEASQQQQQQLQAAGVTEELDALRTGWTWRLQRGTQRGSAPSGIFVDSVAALKDARVSALLPDFLPSARAQRVTRAARGAGEEGKVRELTEDLRPESGGDF